MFTRVGTGRKTPGHRSLGQNARFGNQDINGFLYIDDRTHHFTYFVAGVGLEFEIKVACGHFLGSAYYLIYRAGDAPYHSQAQNKTQSQQTEHSAKQCIFLLLIFLNLGSH